MRMETVSLTSRSSRARSHKWGRRGRNGSLFPKKVDLQALMKYYDLNQDGNITYEEFLNGLRDELTERRKAMVDKAWAIMDKDGSG